RHDEQGAEADEDGKRHQRPAVDCPPPLGNGALVGAGEIHARAPGSAWTRRRKTSPRSSKLANWSKDAQAGDNSTTAPGLRCASAVSRAAATARPSSPQRLRGTRPSSVAANSSVALPMRKAWQMRGNNGASEVMPPSLGMPPAIQ